MEIRAALIRQYRAAILMTRQAIEVTPDDLWTWGEHPRTYWRIAYHALGYAHLYLYEDMASWKPWAKAQNHCAILEGEVQESQPYTREELLDFADLILSEIEERINALDLDAPTCGFTWYPNVSRVELLVLSLRHLHGHLGQLHEHLIARGLDVKWHGEPPANASDPLP